MIVAAWESVSKEVIIKSFACTGQSQTCVPADISCLKENGIAHDPLKDVQEMWQNVLLNGLTLERAYFNSAELFLRVYTRAGLE